MANMPPFEAMVELLRERGNAFSRDDYSKLQALHMSVPVEDAFAAWGWIVEGLTLTVSDPAYKGDLTLADLD